MDPILPNSLHNCVQRGVANVYVDTLSPPLHPNYCLTEERPGFIWHVYISLSRSLCVNHSLSSSSLRYKIEFTLCPNCLWCKFQLNVWWILSATTVTHNKRDILCGEWEVLFHFANDRIRRQNIKEWLLLEYRIFSNNK